ncbi:PepSY domain-containing protein [Flavihumibacter rivuli]|uniref:PepSY-associated TM helix domain-containing protein n=1 Tax=Flavihumibacter rivuli TaxID=2838156 RepID=UPI001BDF5ED4|nr:PepSY-associated TM helix domain-containing protein [Flavihumibacter rivuli]ULQ55077.1 PepSY domain-containing protein [Flavihumibacter rivuli]
MKVFFRRIHLYLGLAAGLVIMVTCLTGALLVFEKELTELFHPRRYSVEAIGQPVPVSVMEASIKQQEPGAMIQSIKFHTDPRRSVEFSYTIKKGKDASVSLARDSKAVQGEEAAKPGTEKKGEKKGAGGGERRTAFVNPYTGEVLELFNYRESFFYKVMDLHRWLLVGDTGKLIVGSSTLIFLFILITGIILWWPRNRKLLLQRLKLKWDAGWKRVNHDLHIVLGFYSAIVLFILAFTGLAWSFEWFNKGIYRVTNSPMEGKKLPVIAYLDSVAVLGWQEVAEKATKQVGEVSYLTIAKPKDFVSAYQVTVLPLDAVHESATDQYFLDPYTGALAGTLKWSERNTGQRVRAIFKPVHVASIYGLPSKLIGLVVCLLGVSFPVTGVILWWNRTRKKKSRSSVVEMDDTAAA